MKRKKTPVLVQDAFDGFMGTIQSMEKRDYNVPASGMTMKGLDICFNDAQLPTTAEFRGQMYSELASGLKSYGDFLEDEGQFELLNKNVNELKAMDNRNRIVRTIVASGVQYARAEVSDKYMAIDNSDVFGRVYDGFNAIADKPFRFLKSHIGVNSASVKFLSTEKFVSLGNRDLFYGFMVSNSEIGMGFCRFETFLFDSFCTNGAIFGKRQLAVLKFLHKGAQILDMGRINLTMDTAKRSQVNYDLDEALKKSMSTVPNHGLKEKLEFAYGKRFEGSQTLKVIDETIKRYAIPMHAETIMANIEKGEESTVYGIQAGITKYAQTMTDYEDRLKFEMIGGAILEDAPMLFPILNEVSKIA